MKDNTILGLAALGLIALVMMMPIFILLIEELSSSKAFADMMRKWLSPKTAIIAAAAAFLCWQAYRARCAYESKCSAAVAAYEKVR